ncbi:MAG: iron-sulfur cluster-binding protein [Gammaproteobacteria bacterium]|nr:iron-sulfur cluster-binding protein [Gammaproteobacteria bacterium]
MSQADFRGAASVAVGDVQLRGNFRRAMDGLMEKRAAQFTDADEEGRLRALGESIRSRSLARLPELLEKLEASCKRNGIQVHWAETTADANQTVMDILKNRGARTLVKGKSMVSEEMELNHFLEAEGIEALESDLGEYIIQLAGEMPSHIVMPVIHRNTGQIAELMEQKIEGAPYTEDADELCQIARKVLREKFYRADAGVSGVNFAVAETGTLCLVENEGNGRMSTTAPRTHIAVMGIEKVVEHLQDVPPLLSLLTRSATGQHITTYFNMISSPRRPGEVDGPEEVHLVLLDNGRSRIVSDPELKATLRCIRCGACMNHCPVYTRVGGHAYQAVIPGPIGKILTPQLQGLDERGDLPFGSTLCNACVEVCPVKIPIVELLLRLRAEANSPTGDSSVKGSGAKRDKTEALLWSGWQRMHASGKLYNSLSRVLAKTGNLAPGFMPPLSGWTATRTKPRFASQTLHQLARKRGVPDE